MRHRVAGRKLGRVTSHRTATLRNMATALFERDRIRTTLMKAKELRPFAERLITLSRKGGLHRRRLVARHIHDRRVLKRLFDTISARYLDRPGGYTRILKLGPRQGDGAEMALVEMVGMEPAVKGKDKGTEKKGGAKRKEAPQKEKKLRGEAAKKADREAKAKRKDAPGETDAEEPEEK